MDKETFDKAYKRIRKLIHNYRTTQGSIADEIVKKSYVDLDDLTNEVALRFWYRKHKPIRKLDQYVNSFTYREMMNLKRMYVTKADNFKEYIKYHGKV